MELGIDIIIARFGALIALLLLPSCSFAFTSGPPKGHERLPTFDCSTSYTVPGLDAIWVGFNLLVLTNELADDNPSPDRNLKFDLGLGAVFVAAGVAGAIVGFERVKACKAAKLRLYERLGREQERRKAALEGPSPPPPGLTLEPQDAASFEVITQPLDGGTVFVTTDATRVNQMERELGKVYVHDKPEDGPCDPVKVSPWLVADSATLERNPPLAERVALHLLEPKTETEVSTLSRLDLHVDRDDVAMVEVRQAARSLTDNDALETYLTTVAENPANLDKCLYYVHRVTSYRFTTKVFRRQPPGHSAGVLGVRLADGYYASDGSLQTAYGFEYGIKIFKLAVDGASSKLVQRPLSPKEARSFEAALASH